jgi:hypothetical protein
MGIAGVVAGFSTLAATLTVGCSGDDNGGDAGDSGNDGTVEAGKDAQPDNFVNDVNTVDVVDAGDADAQNPIDKFRSDLATAVCTRYQGCCNTLDAGAFDFNKCYGIAINNFWEGSNTEISRPGVIDRGNLTLNQSAATSCLAGLATLSCPTISGSEFKTTSDNCFAAVTGTLANGANCIQSAECKSGEYCKFAGVDAGTTDGGQALGICANLVGDGGACGADPYGTNFQSDECAYEGWQAPPSFCNYDNSPNNFCSPLRANAATCFSDNECASGMCGEPLQDCSNGCTCITSRDISPACGFFGIKDAGTD